MSNTRKGKEEKVKHIKLEKSFSEHQISHLAAPNVQDNAADRCIHKIYLTHPQGSKSSCTA